MRLILITLAVITAAEGVGGAIPALFAVLAVAVMAAFFFLGEPFFVGLDNLIEEYHRALWDDDNEPGF